MIIFTSICSNYGHKARALASSVKQYLPEATFYVCLTEKEIPQALQEEKAFEHVVLSKDAWNGNFERFIFKHSIVEASTAVKAAFFQWLMDQYPEEDSFIYLDPDCYVYSDFVELKEKLKTRPIVLCPHLLHPGNLQMELSSTMHGVYNLGFLALNNSAEARRLIDWWAERLFMMCYDDIPHGIFTDQKWMELAPCFFDVEIMHHDGYDFAPWALLDSSVERKEDGWYIQGKPLRFMHFSGFGPTAEKCMDDWLGETNQEFRQLYAEYAKVHEECDYDHISQTPWSYAYYESGEKINDDLRKLYRQDKFFMDALENPFEINNALIERHFQPQPVQPAEETQQSEQLQEAQPQPDLPQEETVVTLPEKSSLGKKMKTARWVVQEFGISGIGRVLWEKITGKQMGEKR
ncbi:MAG: hypothetical protein IJ153_04705 [Clostridia bacterium]|nr:hypothetical protein [Clostridia bacterium]